MDGMPILLLGNSITILGRPLHKYSLLSLVLNVILWVMVRNFGSRKIFGGVTNLFGSTNLIWW